ncbi:hypothetical protein KC19_2G150000 [Ceratodon purpureus]|uniref:Zinc-finger domain-containing protein n=1 Tax=Ceratodon purpureus TaxID=3225 RepID=A0A8T0IVL2_CERPU|nr:hypothetical protein KC19_2G150000 [Ceratodon purpureus]
MEIGTRAMETKLTDVYRVGRKTSEVEKVMGGRLGDGVCRVVKKELRDWYESENPVEEKVREDAALVCRGVDMSHFLLLGVQSGYNSFPGMKTGVNSFEIQKPGDVSLQKIKLELLSPGSCVTNDSVFRDGSGTGNGEIPSTAHANAETGRVDAEPVSAFPCENELVPETEVTRVMEGDALRSSVRVASVSVSPVKGLTTALVMVRDGSIVEQTKQPLTPASSDGSNLEVPSGVMVTGGLLSSVQKELGPVKEEAVEFKDELLTALDMSGRELVEEGPSGETETHSLSRKIEALPPCATSNKLIDALDMSPTEVHKPEVIEHPQVDVGCEEMSFVPIAKVNEVAAPLKSVLVHVKGEPVDNYAVTGAGSVLKELEPVAIQNQMSQIPRNAVKQKLLNSTPEPLNPTPKLRNPSQGLLNFMPEDTEYSLSGSEESDKTEVESMPIQVQNGAEEIIGSFSRTSQRTEQTQESQKEKEIKNRNSNPGRRIQGGRIYDSSLGRTCHWCRQKTVEHHVKCRKCTIYYCGPCLMNRNGENVMEELAEGVRWLCPKCRNGCGPGCENCCNCGPCRKASGKTPTGQLIREARNAGFLNAHDYLVHLNTGETPETIAQRKVGRDWTNCGRFEWKNSSEDSSSDEPSSSDEGMDEFTLNEETSTQLHEGKIGMRFVKKFVQSQLKRKRGVTRGALPAKRSQVEASFPIIHRDINSTFARSRVPAENISTRKENEVGAASRRVEQNLKEHSAGRLIQEDVASRNQNGGMRIKREFVEANVGGSDVEDTALAKRRKLEGSSGGHRYALSGDPVSSRSSLLGPFPSAHCKVELASDSEDNLCNIAGVDNSNEAGPRRKVTSEADTHAGRARSSMDSVSESELTLKMRRASVLNGSKTGLNNAASQLLFEQRGLECPSDPQGTEYRTKLKFALAQPFDAKELEILEESAKCRKPVQKLRQMRGRIVDVITEDEGFSYLDHHEDFALKLEEAESPPLKLALLRGFFFWLQHSCMEGAFRPWPGAPTESRPQQEDCIETEGPDCQVTAVVFQLDEGKDALQQDESNEAHCQLNHNFTDMVQRPLASINGVCGTGMPYNPLLSSTMTQTLIPFQARKNFVQHVNLPKMKGQVLVHPGINYRVILGLPAPALCKVHA